MVWSEKMSSCPHPSLWVFRIRVQVGQGAVCAEPEEPEGDWGLRWRGHEALKKRWVGWGHSGHVKRSQGHLGGKATQGRGRWERGGLSSGEAPGSSPGPRSSPASRSFKGHLADSSERTPFKDPCLPHSSRWKAALLPHARGISLHLL